MSGRWVGHGLDELRGVARLGHHLVPEPGQQRGQPGPHQRAVLGQHHPKAHGHGSSTRIEVGPPGGLDTETVPPTTATRSASPDRPLPRLEVGPADAVVPDLQRQQAARELAVDPGAARPAVLGDVGQRLGDHEIGRRLDRLRRPAVQPERQLDRHRRAVGGLLGGGRQPPVSEHLGVDAVDELAQFGQGQLRLLMRVRHLIGGRPGGQVKPGEAEAHRQRHQPLLRAVVQVPFNPPPFGFEGVDQTGAGLRHLRQLHVQVGRGGQQPPGEPALSHRERGHQVGAADQQDQPGRDGRRRLQRGADRHPRPEPPVSAERDRQRRRDQGQRNHHRRDRHGQVKRPQQRHEDHRVAELPPGRRLPAAGRQPAPRARAGRDAVRIGDRRRIDEPEPPSLDPAHRDARERQRGQQRKADQRLRQAAADRQVGRQHRKPERAGEARGRQVGPGSPRPGRDEERPPSHGREGIHPTKDRAGATGRHWARPDRPAVGLAIPREGVLGQCRAPARADCIRA